LFSCSAFFPFLLALLAALSGGQGKARQGKQARHERCMLFKQHPRLGSLNVNDLGGREQGKGGEGTRQLLRRARAAPPLTSTKKTSLCLCGVARLSLGGHHPLPSALRRELRSARCQGSALLGAASQAGRRTTWRARLPSPLSSPPPPLAQGTSIRQRTSGATSSTPDPRQPPPQPTPGQRHWPLSLARISPTCEYRPSCSSSHPSEVRQRECRERDRLAHIHTKEARITSRVRAATRAAKEIRRDKRGNVVKSSRARKRGGPRHLKGPPFGCQSGREWLAKVEVAP